ncbi:MAG: NYN domain-containing protein [Lachnospiraceae bacterium]
MKRLTMGILAHVDAGKTTLSEAMMYTTGNIRTLGRVDNRDAFLDTYEMERVRGITIFAKQAVMQWEDHLITLLDTPGHVDFSAEMERTLQVLDYAILLISGADGVQAHTRTLWRLLKKYHIPVFLFINKMDQTGTDHNRLMDELKTELNENCVDFTAGQTAMMQEAVAMCDEIALEQFLEHGNVATDQIQHMIRQRTLFPCYFGSALKLQGIDGLLKGIAAYSLQPEYSDRFSARVFKISRDAQGSRLTHLKVTGGTLQVKDVLTDAREKVNQIRVYSGEKYETAAVAKAGCICAVTGLSATFPGQGLGAETEQIMPVLEPVLTYQIILPEGQDAVQMLPRLRQLEEEEPELRIEWDDQAQEIRAQIMGDVQLEILKSTIHERFGVDVSFGTGSIVYKEAIRNCVEGVGHFEPLRHYAEVHLLLEPSEPGSGMQYAADCSEDILDRSWQRLILTHLAEREHRGVLTGSPVTDIKITLVSGRAHQKHTEGGDFRQATYRAVRQGLKQAEAVLLEPYFDFRLEIPQGLIGRAMTDIEQMKGTFEMPLTNGDQSVLTGSVPVVTAQNYHKDVIAYSKGQGQWLVTLKGYLPCHNADEVIDQTRYDSELDLENPTGSVFCSHGAGFAVSWDLVKDYMHLESVLITGRKAEQVPETRYPSRLSETEVWLGTEEVDAILERTSHANKKDGISRKKWSAKKPSQPAYQTTRVYRPQVKKEEYLLIDGYNIIFAWETLKDLAVANMDAARGKLMDILCNYQAIKNCNLILVFDAYRVEGHTTEIIDYHNIHVVYTKEAETADQYIEKFAHQHGRTYDVTVATSDGLEQIIIRSQGCWLLSAKDLEEEIRRVSEQIREEYLDRQKRPKSYLDEVIPEVWHEQ